MLSSFILRVLEACNVGLQKISRWAVDGEQVWFSAGLILTATAAAYGISWLPLPVFGLYLVHLTFWRKY